MVFLHFKKVFLVPVEIRKIFSKPDRNRSRLLRPEVRPEPVQLDFRPVPRHDIVGHGIAEPWGTVY